MAVSELVVEKEQSSFFSLYTVDENACCESKILLYMLIVSKFLDFGLVVFLIRVNYYV